MHGTGILDFFFFSTFHSMEFQPFSLLSIPIVIITAMQVEKNLHILDVYHIGLGLNHEIPRFYHHVLNSEGQHADLFYTRT